MPGIAELALAGAPLAGGALLGLVAGNLRTPDIRGMIKEDMDLLERIPPEQAQRRADLQRVIDLRVDDMIAAVDKNRELRQLATSYSGNWRDILVFVCAVLFAFVWWDLAKGRANFWPMFVVLIILAVVAAVYATRGILRGVATFAASRRRARRSAATS